MKIKRILREPSLFDEMNLEEQNRIEAQLDLLNLNQLETILKSIPLEEGDSFYKCVARTYARHFVQNIHQERIFVDSFMNERIMKRSTRGKNKCEPE